MKYVKTLGLAAVAAMALMAFFGASSASAAVLCKTNTDPCTAGQDLKKAEGEVPADTLTSSLTTGTSAVLKAAFSEVKCSSSHVNGKITNTGGTDLIEEKLVNTEVQGELTELSFTECTCGARTAHVTTTSLGSLKVNDAGTVTSINTRATINCTGLAKCVFGTVAAGTDIGKFTETVVHHPETKPAPTIPAKKAELDAEATLTWFSGAEDSGQFVCAGFGDTGTWTATYQVTTPESLYISHS
jgi:hypothetical protein